MRKFLILCFALFGFVFSSFANTFVLSVDKNHVNDVGKSNIERIIEIVDVNSRDIIYIQNKTTYVEYESWRMFELGYNESIQNSLF